MAYTNTDTNMTTSSALSAGMQTYYNRELLRTFEPNLVHLQFGDEHRMPPHSGLVMNMRKLIPLETNTKALSEGDPGESVMLAETEVTVQLQQYGEYARCTDKLDLTHLAWTSCAARSCLATRAREASTRWCARSWRSAQT